MKVHTAPYTISVSVTFTLVFVIRINCQNTTVSDEPLRPGFPVVAPNTPVINGSSDPLITVDSLITPSDTCKEIVGRFATAISDFTHCSVTNSRPIHLCEWCIAQYLSVEGAYHELFVTVDEKGLLCKAYFSNLDRIEIVADAYKYVHNLWAKGKCNYCFKKSENGTLLLQITDDLLDFLALYEETTSCFNNHMDKNDTCKECEVDYEKLNSFYIDSVQKSGENTCLDMVDTMNTTRDMWNEIYKCIPPKRAEIWLHVGFGVFAALPLIFYSLAYGLSTTQESKVFHQLRLADFFAATSYSGESEMPGFLSSRLAPSTGITTSASNSIKTKTSSDPPQHCDITASS